MFTATHALDGLRQVKSKNHSICTLGTTRRFQFQAYKDRIFQISITTNKIKAILKKLHHAWYWKCGTWSQGEKTMSIILSTSTPDWKLYHACILLVLTQLADIDITEVKRDVWPQQEMDNDVYCTKYVNARSVTKNTNRGLSLALVFFRSKPFDCAPDVKLNMFRSIRRTACGHSTHSLGRNFHNTCRNTTWALNPECETCAIRASFCRPTSWARQASNTEKYLQSKT